jgi:transcriptional regulator with XRE-family HTH domain
MATATKHSRPKIRKAAVNQIAGVDLRALRQRHGLSQGLLARLLDVSLRTVSGLESGSVAPAQLRRNLTQADRLCSALAEAMDSGYIGRWLDEPNEMLGGLKPVEAIERGQIDLVWQVVEGLRSGSPL